MSSQVPIIKQISWPALGLHMAILFVAFQLSGAGSAQPGAERRPLVIAWVFLVLMIVLRSGVARAHRKGISCMRRGEFAEAVTQFQKSFDFFSRHQWVDRLRYITLLSASKASYREMALCNAAFAYSQLGQGKQSEDFYRRALELFPDSGLAKSGLNMLQAGRDAGSAA